ncbi:hydroxyacid dehydrogenase [Asaia sp. As-1742]|uniref:hydroxyacid dehydrogenase n=1 Tax=Asaia sp. As-1742 TaxID=2608325 RepID=UPI0014207DC5|nr:hydroxyacid dehydrogenase [Asaia sp. As-1742]NIE79501.1 hydroxyacid dehydrogenase [Asaia sp. As-1742]
MTTPTERTSNVECFLTQPVHPVALTYLKDHGISTRFATRLDAETVEKEIGDADAVITRDFGLHRAAIDAAPQLRIIACHGAGTNRIDMAAARERGIIVTNTPGTNSQSVAELTIGLILASARQIVAADSAVREGDWAYRYRCNGMELHGKTLGLIGFGAIARKVSSIARLGLGMNVSSWSPSVPPALMLEHQVVCHSTLESLLATSDVISIHRAGTNHNTPLLDAQMLGAMRPGAFLVNVARGSVIDQNALLAALECGKIAGAALDVLASEPPPADDPLLNARAVTLTPHLGGTTEEALQRMALKCAMQVRDALDGSAPEHRLA